MRPGPSEKRISQRSSPVGLVRIDFPNDLARWQNRPSRQSAAFVGLDDLWAAKPGHVPIDKCQIAAFVMTRPETIGVGSWLAEMSDFLRRMNLGFTVQEIIEERDGSGRVLFLQYTQANGWPGADELRIH